MHIPTVRAGLRGVGRRNDHHGHPVELRLVFDEPPELVKSPGIEATTLSLRNRFPFSLADTREVFKGHAAIGAFGFGHNTLGDTVIDIPTEPGSFP